MPPIPRMNAAHVPTVGERVTYHKLDGYVLVQDRPFRCRRGGCVCGSCCGTASEHSSTVKQVIHWGDNSIELVLEDGWRMEVVGPHGDAC